MVAMSTQCLSRCYHDKLPYCPGGTEIFAGRNEEIAIHRYARRIHKMLQQPAPMWSHEAEPLTIRDRSARATFMIGLACRVHIEL
jgi:hypothetical protein